MSPGWPLGHARWRCTGNWGDRPDSHRLGPDPQSGASTTSASVTVEDKGVEPLPAILHRSPAHRRVPHIATRERGARHAPRQNRPGSSRLTPRACPRQDSNLHYAGFVGRCCIHLGYRGVTCFEWAVGNFQCRVRAHPHLPLTRHRLARVDVRGLDARRRDGSPRIRSLWKRPGEQAMCSTVELSELRAPH